MERAISQGAEKFLLKSVTPVEKLVEEVKALIKKRAFAKEPVKS
jgi:DNA-binding NarL/FixJ family response regulator